MTESSTSEENEGDSRAVNLSSEEDDDGEQIHRLPHTLEHI